MNEGPFSISVAYPLDEGGFRYFLRIDHTGRAELTIESNVETPRIEAIGIYGKDIGYDRALALKGMFSTLRKRPLPSGEPGLPTVPMVHVTLEEFGMTESRMIDPTTSPPAMCKVADHLKDVGKELIAHPLKVITMKTGVEKNRLVRSEPLKLSVGLTAEGSEAVMAVNPLAAADKGEGGFTLWGVRSDLPSRDLWPQHSKHQALTEGHLLNADIPVQVESPGILVLKPYERAQYEFIIPITWEPGEYAVKIIFESIPVTDRALRGNIISMPFTLAVREAADG